MTGSSPMHTLSTRASSREAPESALLSARLSSWVQKVASRVARLGQFSFRALSTLQPLHRMMHQCDSRLYRAARTNGMQVPVLDIVKIIRAWTGASVQQDNFALSRGKKGIRSITRQGRLVSHVPSLFSKVNGASAGRCVVLD